MARLIDRSFDPTQPLVARRFFVAAGRHFNPGDAFDWKRLSVDQRRTKLLFEAGKLMHPHQQTAQRPVPQPKSAAVADRTPSEISDPKPDVVLDQHDEPDDEMTEAVLSPDSVDGLDDLNMKELRKLAYKEGAPSRTSRETQIEAIREYRAASGE
ncbi:MAG TPA: hypothetical protein VIG24_02775 [Acidimicrobiia bacterium]